MSLDNSRIYKNTFYKKLISKKENSNNLKLWSVMSYKEKMI
jgi:hypothetical protein